MKKVIKRIYNWVVGVKYKKYIIVLVLGVLLVGFIGDSSVVAHLANKGKKAELQKDIDHYETQYQQAQKEVQLLLSDPKAVVRKARELYYMKADDEDIFIMSSDDAK